jgi:tRNA A37 N6-isopentenylltransferase MiaA
MPVTLRPATPDDIPALQALIADSARGLSRGDYSAAQIEAAIGSAWGVDSELIRDQTYFVAESGGEIVACGGWSRRKTLFGGDQQPGRQSAVLDPDRDAAHRRLEGIDPAAATVVHPHDRKRLIRALELAETGTSLVVGRDRLWSTETRRPAAILGLQVDAAVLEQRIRARTVEMFTRGVVDEVRSALIAGVSRTAAKTLGLEEIARLGPDAVGPIVARTRRYAAYQRKWMRRIPGVVLVDGNPPPDAVAEEILTRTGV